MDSRRILCCTISAFAVLFVAFTARAREEKRPVASAEVRNNAASLLYDLLREEKELRKLLVVKRDSDELHKLIKAIASDAGDNAKRLETFAKEDASMDLRAAALPAGERATRESISKEKAGELLHAKGAAFEFKLLLTQVEALGYATHLAKVAAANETSATRAEFFLNLSKATAEQREQVITLLRARAQP